MQIHDHRHPAMHGDQFKTAPQPSPLALSSGSDMVQRLDFNGVVVDAGDDADVTLRAASLSSGKHDDICRKYEQVRGTRNAELGPSWRSICGRKSRHNFGNGAVAQ